MEHTSDKFRSEIEIAISELNNKEQATIETLRHSLMTLEKVANEIPDEQLGSLLSTDNLLVIFNHALAEDEEFGLFASFANTTRRGDWIANGVLAWDVAGRCVQRSRLWVMKVSGKPASLNEAQGIAVVVGKLEKQELKIEEIRAAAVRFLTTIAQGIPLDPRGIETLKYIRNSVYIEERSPIVIVEYAKLFTILGFTGDIPENRRGLTEIAGCNNAERIMDIVFVHGLGGDSWTTWMADKEDLASFWPNWIAADFQMAGVWTLGYAASRSNWQEESMALADRGNQVLDLLENQGLGERPLVFVTHSMGGIVVKQILRHAESFGVSRWESIAANTKGIAFIATPHSGANIASFAEFARAVLRTSEQVSELSAHHARLRELHGWFLDYQRRNNVICRTYCETRELRPEIPLLGLKLPKGILVVDETSAEPNIPGERAIPLDEDHLSICKPSSRDSQIYRSICRFLSELEEGISRLKPAHA